jgi:plasmid stabilization system protein ParE
MSKNYVLAPLALADLESIQTFYQETRGEKSARKVVDDLEKKMDVVGMFPRIGTPRDHLLPGLLIFACQSYNIFYYIKGGQTIILRVLHESIDVSDEMF